MNERKNEKDIATIRIHASSRPGWDGWPYAFHGQEMGKFSTELFQRYQRSEQALVPALMETVVNGVSA
jgi:hypothetical protein